MGRPSHREKILCAGLKVVHERGFGAASVRDIVRAAGVPQGSFTNHFVSKEAFGLEVLNLYFEGGRQTIADTLANETLTPLKRLAAYVDKAIDELRGDDMRNGCLLGNFSAEVVDHSEAMRLRLVEIFAEVRAALADCLAAAVKAGELPRDFDVTATAGLIHSGLQGAILVAKAERDPAPAERFRTLLFNTILR